MSMTRITSGRIDGRHVMIALLIFFGTLFAVNAVFLYYAIGTFNGFETSNAYRKGLNYNERISADTAQLSLGWTPAVRFEPEKKQLRIEITDRSGQPVRGLMISGEIRRPVTDREDRALELHEGMAGIYAADIGLAPGQWSLTVRATSPASANGPEFRFKQRLWVRPE